MPKLWLFRKKKCRMTVKCLICLILLSALLCGSVGILSGAVKTGTKGNIITLEELSLMEPESFDLILVLGCRVYADGRLSDMLADRVATGAMAFDLGIATSILMSGDAARENYNEVDPMKARAIELGVPEERILTDSMGLSTYESIKRLKEEWKGKRVLIVTQEYHLYRALYLAEKFGIEAYGLSADLRTYRGQWKRDAREILARVKDIYYGLVKP